jgi:tRNA threonylcarbamoyladenosine biosynthesis protein TsaE
VGKKQITKKEMEVIARNLVKKMPDTKVFTFTGPLGAGKTTLVQEMFKSLGVQEPVQSPTYTYMSVYRLPENKTLYHFDLYRLKTEDDFIATGFDEYLYQPNSWCFIEWPEVIDNLLKEDVCHIILDYADDDMRTYEIKK